jgi:uncharacterized surface protein with fasciclin (FAS1) repeats
VKARTIAGADSRRAIALSFPVLTALAAFSGPADARGCGTMRPPAFMAPAATPMRHPMHHPSYKGTRYGYPQTRQSSPSVIDVAKRAGGFDTLIAAVEKAGLTGLLEGSGPYTLFAPTEAAFEGLPEGALDELLEDKEKLAALLKYHVVPGRVTATDVLTSRTLKTASGQDLSTADLSVIRADIGAGNGVIHVVDKVLLPSG